MTFITLLSLILSAWFGEPALNTIKRKRELEKQEVTNRGQPNLAYEFMNSVLAIIHKNLSDLQ